MLEVIPGTNSLTGKAIVTGVLTSGKESVICINPASKASSYALRYKIRDRIFREVVNNSELQYYILKNRYGDVLSDVQIQAMPY
jgi:hypothetical protein